MQLLALLKVHILVRSHSLVKLFHFVFQVSLDWVDQAAKETKYAPLLVFPEIFLSLLFTFFLYSQVL